MKRQLLSGIALSLMFVVVLAVAIQENALAVNQSTQGKVINVVYDDSRSMYLNGETRWCQAKYAMEVFCAMMGAEDTMNIFSMNREDVLTIRGNDSDRVAKVHAMTSLYRGTPFSTVKKAGDALSMVDPSFERWLVILTDGSFESTTVSKVQTTLDNYNKAGIKTVYLGIGNDAVELQNNPSKGGYAEKASSTHSILSKVTSIANQIFEHQVLGSGFVSGSGSEQTLNIDIPTDQLVVFAQGENASVGDLLLNGKRVAPTSTHSVTHSRDVMPLNTDELKDIKVDTSLHGIVVTYDAGDAPFEQGQFQVSVSGATTVEYYYRPGVTVNCELRLNGREVHTEDKLYAGDYEVALNFIDPFSGKKLESKLLSAAKFELLVINNNETQVVSDSKGSIKLTEGSVDISAVARLPGNVSLESACSYTVLPEPINLALTLEPNRANYSQEKLGSQSIAVILRVTNGKTGQPLSKEEWEQTEIRVDEPAGLGWSIVKGEEQSTWKLYPLSKDGRLSSVLPGEYSVAVTASYEIGKRVAYGVGTLPLTMGEYAGNKLEVNISAPEGGYDLNDLAAGEPMTIEVKYEDPQTGEMRPLSEEMWNAFAVEARSEEKASWRIEQGDTAGTWKLTPHYYHGDAVRTSNGTVHVDVSVSGESGEYRFSGTTRQQTEFQKLSACSWIRIVGPRILLFLFILWFVYGHWSKNRLHLRKLNPRCRYRNATSPVRKIRKELFSVILPYVPERATVYCHHGTFKCNFPDLKIEATGRNSFKITNKTLPLKTTKIRGMFYEDMKTVRKRMFQIGGFNITSVDPRTQQDLGTFSFR